MTDFHLEALRNHLEPLDAAITRVELAYREHRTDEALGKAVDTELQAAEGQDIYPAIKAAMKTMMMLAR